MVSCLQSQKVNYYYMVSEPNPELTKTNLQFLSLVIQVTDYFDMQDKKVKNNMAMCHQFVKACAMLDPNLFAKIVENM